MKPLLAAIRFLTIVPIPGAWGTAEEDLARSVPWFPVIDQARCNNCLQCLNFCLFGVYAKDAAGRIAAAPSPRASPDRSTTRMPSAALPKDRRPSQER